MADFTVSRGAELEGDYYLVLMKVSLKLRKEGDRRDYFLQNRPMLLFYHEHLSRLNNGIALLRTARFWSLPRLGGCSS